MKILAIGVHPDDIELGCSGLLIRHVLQGDQVYLLDLTEGELGSRGTVLTRYKEAEAAQRIIGAVERKNLKMADGFFENNETNKRLIIQEIRRIRPDILIGNARHDRHPDHGRAHQLINDAAFLSGLIKVDTTCPVSGAAQQPWRPHKVFSYIQDRYIRPDVVFDITEVMDVKIASVKAYTTQFSNADADAGPGTYISRPEFLEQVVGRAREWGHKIGVTFGEGYTCNSFIGLKDLNSVYLPEYS